MTGELVKPNRDVVLRPARGDDIPFITNAWLKAYATSDFAKRVDRDTYFREQTRRMMRLLSRCDVVVAADPDAPGNILGYLVTSSRRAADAGTVTIHWAYVRGLFRRFGILTLMLRSVGGDGARVQYTHQTDKGRQVARAMGWTFNPYAVEE